MPNNKTEERSGDPASWLRPQSVIFTLLAEHVLDRDLAVFSGSFIQVLGRLGIGEHATRSTLARMVQRGLLSRQRAGRKVYFRMTSRCSAILEDGRQRIWHTGAVNERKGDDWTLLTFSLPEAWQRQRYDLRARLSWVGFAPLQNGVWLAPTEVDVAPIIEELKLSEHVRVFRGLPAPPADPLSIIREAFDLETLADSYRGFIEDWKDVAAQRVDDALVLTLRLSTRWLRTIRTDPRVPLHLLPEGWPAVEAQRLFRKLHGAHRKASEAEARRVLEVVAPE